MKYLVIIPARGGSKEVPRKNIKLLNGIPLIYHTIQVAREIFIDDQICVTTDDIEIKNLVENTGLKVPFLRPFELASDNSGSEEVILHALNYYEKKGNIFDAILLLQPTSPFRKTNHIKEAMSLFNPTLDMVVSVSESYCAGLLFMENKNHFLEKVLPTKATRRQDYQKYYKINGAIYIINSKTLKLKPISEFDKIKKYIMDEESSIDIDTMLDFKFAEFLFSLRK